MAVHLNVEFTDACNLRCPMCSQAVRPYGHGTRGGFMDWDTWMGVLEGLEGLEDEVHLCPHWLGEPTVHPDFDRMVARAFAENRGNRLFRTFKLHTNGVLLSPERVELLLCLAARRDQAEDTFSAVHFSLDAASEETWRRVKGGGGFAAAQAGAEILLRRRTARNQPYPRVHLAFVVQPDNAREARAFVGRWRPLLEATGRPWALTTDWPGTDTDAIYIRRLNQGDQEAADRLHREVARSLGLAGGAMDPLRSRESF